MANSGIIYGPTGTFKTTAIAHFARYVAETTGKATLLFSSDGGGWRSCDEEVRAGMIRPFRCDPNTIPLPILRKVSQGYWPENPEESDVSKLNFRPIDWNEVGGGAVEGMTSIGLMLMRHCADKNLKTGEEGTSKFSQPILVDGELKYETFAGNSKGHYNFVQKQLYSLVTNFQSWPVPYILFTGHQKDYAEDGELNCGISVPGKAITSDIPTWFGDCIHAQGIKVPVKQMVPSAIDPTVMVEEETFRIACRYYFVKHPDPKSPATFDAKPRVTHSAVQALEKAFPGGFFTPTTEHGFDLYLKTIERLGDTASQDEALRRWRERGDDRLGRRAGAK